MTPTFETIPFTAADGMQLNLKRVIRTSPPTQGPILLVHGAGVRGNIFNPPNSKNIIQVLSEEGFDVFLENWRGSIEIKPNKWNLDLVAVNDHPAAVKKVCEVTGAKSIQAIIHCQGSTSFMISAVLGLIPEVRTIISNAVSLHPVVRGWSKFKLNFLLPPFALITSYFNPKWGDKAPGIFPKLMKGLVALTHWEKDTMVGKFVSFTYGTGAPALWELNNLTEETKQWIRGEFAEVPLTFFKNIKAGVKNGSLVSANTTVQRIDYAAAPPKTNARFILYAGKLNKCFKYQSQVNTFNWLNKLNPGYHKLNLFDTYSHLDIFLGKNADKDIFPGMVAELKEN